MPCEPGLRAAFALGGMPLIAAFVGVLMVGFFLGGLMLGGTPRDPWD